MYCGTAANPTVFSPPGPIKIVSYCVLASGGVTTAAPDFWGAILSTVALVSSFVDGTSENVLVYLPMSSSNTYSNNQGMMFGNCERIVKPPQAVTLKLLAPSAGVVACTATLVYEML